jgi:hypothetical protein
MRKAETLKAESGENEKETVLISAFSFPFSAFVMSVALAQFQFSAFQGYGVPPRRRQ